MFIFEDAQFTDWLYRALTFLVVSCPCALVISIPLGLYAGLGKASKVGALIKGGNYLELLKMCIRDRYCDLLSTSLYLCQKTCSNAIFAYSFLYLATKNVWDDGN